MFLSHRKPQVTEAQGQQIQPCEPRDSALGSEAQLGDHLNCILLKVARICVPAPNCVSGYQKSKWPT